VILPISTWTNRANTTTGGAADTDHFGAAFGTSAPRARGVVDAVISSYEQMIGSFNYPTAGQHFSLSLSMNVAAGFGAGASSGNTLGGKPITGSVSIGNGNNTADPNDDNGWFLDPTPTESSEFTGNIDNAFAGDAPSGSPANGKFDLYTITLLELTHCMGQFSAYSGFANLTTNTTLNDGALVGKLWVFRGPSIKHLLTSDNAGNTDTGSAIHSAEPQSATFAGDTYQGTEDSGNAIFEFNRRYLVDNVHALMFKDAFGYSTVNPAAQGTMYSIYNETNNSLLIRGGDFASGHSSSNDVITISSTSTTLTVTVDIGSDVAGSGALPGAGDLPSFITQYPISALDSITVQAGSGDDVIFVNSLPAGCSLSIDAGSGNDIISLPSGDFAANVKSNVTVIGGLGTDSLGIDDSAATAASNTYVLTNGTFAKVGGTGALSYSSISNLNIFSTAHTDLVTLGGAGASVNWTGGAGDDVFNIGNGVIEENTFSAPINVLGGTGTDVVRVESQSDLLPASYAIGNTTVSKGGVPLISFSACESLSFNGGGNDDTVDLNLTPGSIPMTLNGNQGDDTFELNVTQTESASPAKVINGGFGNDTVVMNNAATSGLDVSTITNNTLTVFTGPSFNYATVESVVWNCLTTTSKNIFVLSTSSTTPVTINGSSGTELVRVGGLPNISGVGLLDPILGAVRFNGAGGVDTLSLNDHATTACKYVHPQRAVVRPDRHGGGHLRRRRRERGDQCRQRRRYHRCAGSTLRSGRHARWARRARYDQRQWRRRRHFDGTFRCIAGPGRAESPFRREPRS
jgi:hypothetical protein